MERATGNGSNVAPTQTFDECGLLSLTLSVSESKLITFTTPMHIHIANWYEFLWCPRTALLADMIKGWALAQRLFCKLMVHLASDRTNPCNW